MIALQKPIPGDYHSKSFTRAGTTEESLERDHRSSSTLLDVLRLTRTIVYPIELRKAIDISHLSSCNNVLCINVALCGIKAMSIIPTSYPAFLLSIPTSSSEIWSKSVERESGKGKGQKEKEKAHYVQTIRPERSRPVHFMRRDEVSAD